MQGYTETNYENSIVELFTNNLQYDYVYDPDVERDFYSPLYNVKLTSLSDTLLPKLMSGEIDVSEINL